ncbi:MAG TPA: hypothetical protein VF094_08850 [Gaiellaceae bacterium]
MTEGALELLVAELAEALAPRVAELVAAQLPPVVAAQPWKLTDVAGVARMLGRSERWVRDRSQPKHGDGAIPWVRLDAGQRMYDPDAVRAWALDRSIPERPAVGAGLRAVS